MSLLEGAGANPAPRSTAFDRLCGERNDFDASWRAGRDDYVHGLSKNPYRHNAQAYEAGWHYSERIAGGRYAV